MTNPRDPHAGQPVATAGAPPGDAPIMIMMHGRGASPGDILGIARALDRPAFSYMAPAAAGGTWYPWRFTEPIERNEPWLSSALHTVDTLVRDLASRGVPHERIFLLGFSQGGCLAAEYAVRHARRYGGIFVLSGGLIGPPGTPWQYDGAFDRTPVFLGCSDVDPHVPLVRVEESAAVFERMGAVVTKHIYRGMGHFVNDDEIAQVRRIMDAPRARRPPPSTAAPGP